MSKTIKLSRGFVAVVDDADYEALSRFHWHAVTDRYGNHYARTGWNEFDGRRTHIIMGRELLKAESRKVVIKYRNGDTLDNQRENLILLSRKKEDLSVSDHEPARDSSL